MSSVEDARAARWGPSRILRLCTGVDELILSKEPSERPRYTAMGGVVLGTALMAMLSMSYALYCVFDGFRPIIVAVVLIWGLFILSIDRWLMSGPPLSGDNGVWQKAVPRLVLSIMLGFVVAEPLLLGVFDTAIQERVAKDRQTEVTTREDELKRCNPVPGTEEAKKLDLAACAGKRLQINATPPDVLQADLEATRKDADALRKQLNTDSAKHADLEEKARRECNGDSGPGLTGRRGVGLNCKRLRGEADTYYRTHQMAANGKRLVELDNKVKDLTGKVTTAQVDYADATDAEIRKELDAIRARHKEVGLLERFRTLDDLVDENGYVRAAQWGIRLFLVIVDALPILLKVMNGSSAHDRALARRIHERERRDEMDHANETHAYAERLRSARHRVDLECEAERRDQSREWRERYAHQIETREAIIGAREQYLLKTALGPAVDVWELESTQEIVIDHEDTGADLPESGERRHP